MTRVFVIGAGPLPEDNPERLGFPQLRTRSLITALLEAGHEVEAVLLGETDAPRGQRELDGASVSWSAVAEERGAWLERVRAARAAARPEVVVSAGPWSPIRAAALCVGEEPLWVDVPGDPMAEAQARSARPGEPDATAHALAVLAPALARGDAFGCISPSQRLALLGQLGLTGRLTAAPPDHPWVGVVPAAWSFGDLPLGAPRARAPGTLTLALAGGYNTWLDVETIIEGVLRAMARAPGLRLISTGGAIEGHHAAGYAHLRQRAEGSAYADRFTFHGWVPHDALPARLAEAHVGLSLDRPGLEPELGTRTRALFFAHQGLEILSSARSDFTRELALRGWMHEVSPGDPEALAERILGLVEQGASGALAAEVQQGLALKCAPARVFEPLLRWIPRAARVPPAQDRAAELGAQLAEARQALARVHESTTWKVGSRVHAALRRLLRPDEGER